MFRNLKTELTLTCAALAERVSFGMEPDGTAVHRFGTIGRYTIACKDGVPVAYDLPATRPPEALAHVCALIEAQQSSET